MGDASSITPAFLKDAFLLLVVLVLPVAALVFSQFRKRLPQPLDVRSVPELMTAESHAMHRETMNGRVSALELRMNRVESKMESDKNEIISAVDHKLEKLEEKIDRTPAGVVALLKDTKGLLS